MSERAGTPLEPTKEMVEAGAQRLVRWETGKETWPDSWSALDVRASRNDAEKVWRSMWLAAPSPAGPDALAEWHDRLGACIDQIGHPDYSLRELVDTLHDIRDGLFALRSRPAQGVVIPKVYQACALHQHLPIMIAASSMVAPIPVCPHCEADAAMSQQEPTKEKS